MRRNYTIALTSVFHRSTVVFVHLHQVEVLLDHLDGDVMPAGVYQDSPVGESRPVLDLSSVDEELSLLQSGALQVSDSVRWAKNESIIASVYNRSLCLILIP